MHLGFTNLLGDFSSFEMSSSESNSEHFCFLGFQAPKQFHQTFGQSFFLFIGLNFCTNNGFLSVRPYGKILHEKQILYIKISYLY